MAQRPFETTFYRGIRKAQFRNTRAASSGSAVALAFKHLECKGFPGDVAVCYDLRNGKLHAEIKATVGKIDVHYFK